MSSEIIIIIIITIIIIIIIIIIILIIIIIIIIIIPMPIIYEHLLSVAQLCTEGQGIDFTSTCQRV